MSETVTMPSLMMMTLIVSEKSLVMDRHTDRHTHGLVYVNVFKVISLRKQKETYLNTCLNMVE